LKQSDYRYFYRIHIELLTARIPCLR